MAQTHTETRTLRLFGLTAAQAAPVLRRAAAAGCPGLKLLGRGGELAVRLAASGPEAASACEDWEKRLRAEFGPAVFAADATSLPQAALDAFLKEEFLFCTADEATGALLEPLLRDLPQARSAYDFGAESWAHPRKGRRIEPPAGWLRRWPACPVQPAAGRAAAALKVSGADFALAFQPAQGRSPAFALLADERSAWVKALNPGQAAPEQAGLWLLDMARRAALGLPQAAGVASFRLGQEAPALVADPEERPAARPAPAPAAPRPAEADTVVAPLRLAPDPAPQPTRLADTQTAPLPPPAAPPAPSEPTGVIRLEPVGRNPRLEQAAQAMYGLVDESAVPDTEPPAPKKQGGGWGRLLAAVFFLLVVAVAAAAGLYYWNSLGEAPAWRGYGTAGFDADAIAYLERARAQDPQVRSYLALPGMDGSLVWADGHAGDPAPAGAALADSPSETAPDRVCYAPGADPSAPASHSLVLCPAQALRELSGLDQLDAVQNNSAFTLYTGDDQAAAYRYKVAAVFYWDPAEEGEGAFDLAAFTDLSDPAVFMELVVGVKARSLFDMPVDFEEGDSFVSLVADAAEPDGTKLVVLGRLVRQQETRSVDTANIAPTTDPLLTAAMYEAAGGVMPDLLELMQSWVNWFGGRNQTNADLQIEAGMPEEEVRLDDVLGSLGELPGLDELMPTAEPTPTPNILPDPETETGLGDTGDTGLPPEVALPTAEPTPAPTPAPEGGESGGETGGEATPAPTPTPTPAPADTINVTMNGTPQTMDLTECLAMIVMNEIGSSAPAEAQKAQAIAAHSWILSQGGGYPSVAGRTPTDSVRANVAQVAHIVAAYGNAVAFTPYHASCAGGTTASKDVWGGVRAYLIEVESPHDATTATNWQTTETYSSATVAARAKEKLGVTLTGDPSTWLQITSATTYGYVTGIRIGTVTKSGTYLQSTLLGGQTDVTGRARTLRSPAFTVQYDAAQDAFVFTVKGYGHGVGMSQWGAIGYARAGWTYDQILAHYYPGTSLATVG